MERFPNDDPQMLAIDELTRIEREKSIVTLPVDVADTFQHELVLARAYDDYLVSPQGHEEEFPEWIEHAITSGVNLSQLHSRFITPNN